ncbi:dynamin-2B-like protein [Tanacetum coccineum]
MSFKMTIFSYYLRFKMEKKRKNHKVCFSYGKTIVVKVEEEEEEEGYVFLIEIISDFKCVMLFHSSKKSGKGKRPGKDGNKISDAERAEQEMLSNQRAIGEHQHDNDFDPDIVCFHVVDIKVMEDDMVNLSFTDESFDVVIEKGTMDVLFVDSSDPWDLRPYAVNKGMGLLQDEELHWMAQEVRGYVEAVLNNLGANVPKAVVMCHVEKAKEGMLNNCPVYLHIAPLGHVCELTPDLAERLEVRKCKS